MRDGNINPWQLPWPVQNIIQRSSIPIYRQIFTFLLQTYRMKYLIQRVSPQSIRDIKDVRMRHLSYKLRQRLIWFADILRSYLTETVIALSSDDMATAMIKAEDIDDMANIHIKFVARLQGQALLSENLKPIHKAIISILDLGFLFSERCFPPAAAAYNPFKSSITRPAPKPITTKSKSTSKPKLSRRKSFIPAIAETLNESSESDGGAHADDEDEDPSGPGNWGFEDSLKTVDREFERLLPFVTAGLRSVGRVGAEPCWEVLAERLGWGEGKDETRGVI
jgi:gamma-tubulin complex component 5